MTLLIRKGIFYGYEKYILWKYRRNELRIKAFKLRLKFDENNNYLEFIDILKKFSKFQSFQH